nr:ATP-binding protein [Pleionea sp. CnH1-48]
MTPVLLDGTTIGYLSLKKRQQLSEANELLFLEQQNETLLTIAGIALAISLLLALPLASHIVKPIKSLTRSTKELTSGFYKTRTKVSTQDEIGNLSRDFNILAQTLENNEEARQRWIADISHELRTPLSILRGEIEAIIDGIRSSDHRSMESLLQEVVQLSRLVNDLYELSLSDLGALDYRKEDINLIDVLDSCVDNFASQLSEKSIELNKHYPSQRKIVVHADRERLRQLFINLLKNTKRYTDEQGQLDIKVQIKKRQVFIYFMDSAPGVPEKSINKLFDRLYRVESSRNRAHGGAGLGLAICQNIVEAHQGEINAKASPLGGLWITIQLPLL